MDLVRVGVGRASIADLPQRIRDSVNFLVGRLIPTAHLSGELQPD